MKNRRPNPRAKNTTGRSRRKSSRSQSPSAFRRVNVDVSSFDRSMLRRAIDSTIDGMERFPKQYMLYFGIESKETIQRSIRSLARTKEKLGL